MAQAHVTHSKPRRVTLDEYMELLDDTDYDVIDGELILRTPQFIIRNNVRHTLCAHLHPYIDHQNFGVVFMGCLFVMEVEQGTNWVRGALAADVAFISVETLKRQKEQFPGDNAFRIAPDLAVEVVSPIDRFAAVLKKVARYLGYGVPLVWVIEAQSRTVYVYTLDQPDGRALHEADTLIGAPMLPEWSMAIRDLFGVE